MALNVDTMVWELRANAGSADNGGGFKWDALDANGGYKWTNDTGSEYYLEASGGGDPGLFSGSTDMDNGTVTVDGWYNKTPQGTKGSLDPDQWDFAQDPGSTYWTIYVRLPDSSDPDVWDSTGQNANRAVCYSTGTDRSQQDNSHANGTDLVIDAATNTDVTSASTPFAADDVGNVINVSAGSGFTVGRYYIVSVSGSTATLDRAVGTIGSTGGTWRLGGAGLVDDTMLDLQSPNFFIKADDTHTLTGNISLAGLAATIARDYWGYKTTRGDIWDSNGQLVEANRPTIAAGANTFNVTTDGFRFYGIIGTTTAASGFYLAGHNSDFNAAIGCKFTNTSASTNREALTFQSNEVGHVIACEASSTNGNAFEIGDGNSVMYCYAHDSTKGFDVAGGVGGTLIAFCIADTCTSYGYDQGAYFNYMNCVAYNCGTGFFITVGVTSGIYVNCLADNCTLGMEMAAMNRGAARLFGCNFSANTTDLTLAYANPWQGIAVTFDSPSFADAPNGDFETGSALAAWPTNMPGGLTALNLKRGVSQRASGAGFIGSIM